MTSTARDIISDMMIEDLVELKDCISSNLADRLEQYQHHYVQPSGDDNLDWVRKEVDRLMITQITEEPLKTLKYVISRIESNGKPLRGGVTEEMIARAREYPIADLYVGTVRNGMCKCPFHEDKTSSLSFRRFNRFRCFGCEAKGSVIDFYMRLHGVGFVQAVKALTR